MRILALLLSLSFFLPTICFSQEKPKEPTLKSENYGSWSLICSESTGDKAHCQISQIISNDTKGEKVVLGISVYFLESTTTKPAITFRMSSKAIQKAGIGLKIDNGDEYRLPINECNDKICTATGLLDTALLDKLNHGTYCQIAFLLQNRQQMAVPVALNGFKESFSRLQSK